jgi:hypothetical protein
VVQGLLTRPASTVNRDRWNAFRPPSRKNRESADIAGLVTNLGHTTPLHVIDVNWVNACSPSEFRQNDRTKVSWVHLREGPISLADGGSNRLHDYRFWHRPQLRSISRQPREVCPSRIHLAADYESIKF